MTSYKDLDLTFREKLFLFCNRKKKSFDLPNEYRSLLRFGLVTYESTGELDKFGIATHTGKYVLTDEYTRYRVYQKDVFFKGKFPVIISLIALIKAFQDEILWLIQAVMRLLK